jgi:hypothetical protein
MGTLISLAMVVFIAILAVLVWRASNRRKDRRRTISQRKSSLPQSSDIQPPPAESPLSIGATSRSASETNQAGKPEVESARDEPTVQDQESPSSTPGSVPSISKSEKQPSMEEAQVPVDSPSPVLQVPFGQSAAESGTTVLSEDMDSIGVEPGEPTRTGGDQPSKLRDMQPRQQQGPISPEKRGGRSREPVPKEQEGRTRKKSSRTPKPEIICWKRGQEWVLAVELSDEFDHDQISVVQDDTALAEDYTERGSWPLAHLRGELVVRTSDAVGEPLARVCLGDDDYLVLKLSGRDLNQGRRVKRVSRGSYLVVAPSSWTRDEAQSGPAPAEPEPVHLDGYRAHFFDLPSGCTAGIVLRDGSARTIEIAPGGQWFELIGRCLPDGCDYLGPLFVSTPPRIRVAGISWENVGKIVLGVEGKGAERWRTYLEPDRSRPEQSLPTAVMERKAGWYFARFYDVQDDLIDSLDFRFAAGLQEISIKQTNPFPREKGHESTTVELHHATGWRVVSAVSGCRVQIEPGSELTILTIPPTPECDHSEWFVGPAKGPEVKVVVLLERVWWAIGTERHEPPQWQDNCLSLTREAFKAISEDAIWLRLPKPRWTERVFFGFCSTTRRGYQVKMNERLVAAPLRDFCDSQELDNRGRDQFFRVWLEANRTLHEATTAVIHADSPKREIEISHISPSRVASVLTKLSHATRGPLRRLFKKVRRLYRKQPWPAASANDEFVKCGLCAVAIFHQVATSEKLFAPRVARRWKSRAELAGKRFPETMRKVWRMYSRSARQNRQRIT